jgi:hypothetical protein
LMETFTAISFRFSLFTNRKGHQLQPMAFNTPTASYKCIWRQPPAAVLRAQLDV